TVDSGNLVASLLVLAQGLDEKRRAPGPSPTVAQGLRERLLLLREAMGDDDSFKKALWDDLAAPPGDDWAQRLQRLTAAAEGWRKKATGNKEAERLAEAFVLAVRRMKEEAESPPGEEMRARLKGLIETARRYAAEMDFTFLF